ncbi:Uncharacterised protein [Vibrio cholerae]|uniref:Uncharacterized protein n=1 Tax=Vibrio cholerae TaxID=666 RepID=A0A655WHG8_VIBCL|nr:Uncharacterised protein [Vibrio cholerae]
MASNAGILRVRQTHLSQCAAHFVLWMLVDGNCWEKTIDQCLLYFFTCQFGFQCCAEQFRTTAWYHDWHCGQIRLAEECFFGITACVCHGLHLPHLQLFTFLRQLHFQTIGEGEIHVIATEQNMFANGNALEGEVAFFFGHFDQ